MKDLMPVVKQSEVLQAEGKSLMKVAAFIIAEVKNQGANALLPKMPFSEIEVLKENQSYIKKMLNLREIEFFLANDNNAKNYESAKVGVKEAALPGKPTIVGFV